MDEDAVGRSVDADTSQEYYDVYFQAENDALNIKGRYFKRHGGGFFGVYSRPGNHDDLGHEYGYLDITYLLQVASELDIELQAAVDQRSNDSFFELSPAGTIPGNPWNPYGLLTNIQSVWT